MPMEFQSAFISKRWRPACLALLVVALLVVFGFSGQSGDASGLLSRQITTELVDSLLGGKPVSPSPEFEGLHLVVRKLAHAAEYGLLAFACALTLLTFPLPLAARNGISAGFCFLCACTDEYLQSKSGSRSGRFTDVLIDMCGVLLVLVVLYLLHRVVIRRRAQRAEPHASCDSRGA